MHSPGTKARRAQPTKSCSEVIIPVDTKYKYIKMISAGIVTRTLYRTYSKNTNVQISRVLSSNSHQSPQIVTTKDGSTIIIWHKQLDFPYECTKPLPVQAEQSTESVLKTQMSSELLSLYNKKPIEYARQELMNITHTTKHRWFPRARDKKAKKTPMDRQYL